MQRFASLRFDRVLATTERDDVVRTVASVGATVTSWNATTRRTYALLKRDTASADADVAELALRCGATLHLPPLGAVRIAPDRARALDGLETALGGRGRPAGIVAWYRDDDALVVEWDLRATALATLVALVDCELAHAPGRTIVPLVPLADEALVAFAAAVLGEPSLDCERLIEPHLATAIAAAR